MELIRSSKKVNQAAFLMLRISRIVLPTGLTAMFAKIKETHQHTYINRIDAYLSEINRVNEKHGQVGVHHQCRD